MSRRPPQKSFVVVDPLGASDVTTAPPTTTTVISPPEIAPEVERPATSEPGERPVPEAELTPDQRRIRHLEDQLAREQGRKDPDVEFDPPAQPGSAENILIHFLEDGFSALGRVWYRGQELEFERGSQPYKDTFDRNGWSWLSLVDNEFAQVDKYKKIMFRRGPWPGKSLADAAKLSPQRPLKVVGGDEPVPPVSAAELEAAAAAEAKRQRAAPRLPAR